MRIYEEKVRYGAIWDYDGILILRYCSASRFEMSGPCMASDATHNLGDSGERIRPTPVLLLLAMLAVTSIQDLSGSPRLPPTANETQHGDKNKLSPLGADAAQVTSYRRCDGPGQYRIYDNQDCDRLLSTKLAWLSCAERPKLEEDKTGGLKSPEWRGTCHRASGEPLSMSFGVVTYRSAFGEFPLPVGDQWKPLLGCGDAQYLQLVRGETPRDSYQPTSGGIHVEVFNSCGRLGRLWSAYGGRLRRYGCNEKDTEVVLLIAEPKRFPVRGGGYARAHSCESAELSILRQAKLYDRELKELQGRVVPKFFGLFDHVSGIYVMILERTGPSLAVMGSSVFISVPRSIR